MTQRVLRRPSADQRRVVEYWRLLELFSPQAIEKRKTPTADHRVTDWRPGTGAAFPWTFLPSPAPVRGRARVWRHTVFLGVYDISALYEHLHRVFPRDEDAYDERPPGQSAAAVITVDGEGRYLPGSARLSSAVWGVGRTIEPGVQTPGWTEGLDEAEEALVLAQDDLLADPVAHAGPDGSQATAEEEIDAATSEEAVSRGPVLEEVHVEAALALAHQAAGVVGVSGIGTSAVRITSQVVSRSSADKAADAGDFLNSFLLDDLLTVSREEWGPSLLRYLTPTSSVDVSARIDVAQDAKEIEETDPAAAQRSVDALLRVLRPERLPAGRWPSKPSQHLATSQQFAVDELAAVPRGTSTEEDAVHGVNGPPGTGKTTLLRDAVAALVVRRAEAIAALTTPQKGFTGAVHEWKAGDYSRTVRELAPQLTGYEVVLASSNNVAVQNVSDELPQRKTIHDPAGTADHFGELATGIARRQRRRTSAEQAESETEDADCWGLVAARLGRSANRQSFASAFWFGQGTDAGAEPAFDGFQKIIKQWKSGERPLPSWVQARRRFREARMAVDELIAERVEAQRRIDRLAAALERRASAPEEARRLQEELRRCTEALPAVRARWEAAETQLAPVVQRATAHGAGAPGALSRLFKNRETDEWQREQRQLDAEVDQCRRDERDAWLAASSMEARIDELRAQLAVRENSRTADDASAEDLQRQVDDDARRWGAAHPTGEWLNDTTARQLNAPWLDEALDAARSELFQRALEVHRAFLANSADAREGLLASTEVVSGVAPRDLPAAARLAAWQLFFLVVPLVSTTFSSVGRMLHGLGADSLGWLFVDEAGQAPPQAVVGATWRAQHLLAVGDPLQLTPVVATPRRMQQDLATATGVGDEWVPSLGSVQHVVDRLSRHGTVFSAGSQDLWVSQPLRVHRRCSSPMFEVCNKIAYNEKMIDGVVGRPDMDPPLYHSAWFDVPATTRGSHLQPAEIDRLRGALAWLRREGVAMSRVIVVTPFRDVRSALDGLAAQHPGLVAGTVHTAQGKEADVVFFVLGGDPAKGGAKKWASATPNLVNVAVSRAKHRLYVIGDREAWRGFPNFDTLAASLAVVEAQAVT